MARALPPARRYGLDLMRAAAVLLVVAAHYVPNLADGDATATRLSDPLGILGVELFFVLSGYLIGGIWLRALEKAKRVDFALVRAFWVRRWLRTLPAFLAFFAFAVTFQWGRGAGTYPDAWRYLFFIQNLWSPLGHGPSPETGFFGVTWSLAFEEWFYLLLPLAILALHRVTHDKRRAVVGAALIFILGSWLLRAVWIPDPGWDAGTRKVVIQRLDALMYGVVAAYAHRYLSARAWARLASLWPFALAGLLIGWWDLAFTYYGASVEYSAPMTRVFLFPLIDGCAAALLARLTEVGESRGPVAVVVSAVSRWSYSLYLGHAFFLLIALFYLPGGLPMPFKAVLALAASVGVAGVSYAAVERPVLRWRDRRYPG